MKINKKNQGASNVVALYSDRQTEQQSVSVDIARSMSAGDLLLRLRFAIDRNNIQACRLSLAVGTTFTFP